MCRYHAAFIRVGTDRAALFILVLVDLSFMKRSSWFDDKIIFWGIVLSPQRPMQLSGSESLSVPDNPHFRLRLP